MDPSHQVQGPDGGRCETIGESSTVAAGVGFAFARGVAGASGSGGLLSADPPLRHERPRLLPHLGPYSRPARSFLINQFGLLFDEVTASNLVEVDLEGRVLGSESARINPAGLVVHTAIYEARPDVACVLHTHSSAGAAVSMLEDGLLPVSQFALQFYGRLAYHDYEGIILDHGERDRLVDDLGSAHAMILRNHGLLTVGRSVGEAFTLMHNLEQACEVQLRAMSSGARLRYLSEDLCRLTARQHATFDGSDIGETEWAALMRDIERTAPECLR